MRLHIYNKTELGDLPTHLRLKEIQRQCGTVEGVICRLQVTGCRSKKINIIKKKNNNNDNNNSHNNNYNNSNNTQQTRTNLSKLQGI